MGQVKYEPCPRCRSRGNDSRGDNLVVWPDGGHHCFSCGLHLSPTGLDFLRSKIYEERRPVESASNLLPSDFTRDVPAFAWQWLLQYGLGFRYWQPHVGWSEKFSRLVFTVGSPVEFSIGRYIQKPGTLEPDSRKWYNWGETHKTPHVFGDYRESKEVVLVEDLISAHKIGRNTSCIPLFGTKIFDSVIPVLRHIRLPVLIWLDNDQSHTMPSKCYNLSRLTGLPVRYISTTADPKLQSQEKIKEILNV